MTHSISLRSIDRRERRINRQRKMVSKGLSEGNAHSDVRDRQDGGLSVVEKPSAKPEVYQATHLPELRDIIDEQHRRLLESMHASNISVPALGDFRHAQNLPGMQRVLESQRASMSAAGRLSAQILGFIAKPDARPCHPYGAAIACALSCRRKTEAAA